MEEHKKAIELMKKEVKASWAWFLNFHNESTMIATRKTNRKWFREWKPYFDIKIFKILIPRQKTEKTEKLGIRRKYNPNLREKEEYIELNKKIIALIKQGKDRNQICKKLKLNQQKLGHRLSKLESRNIIKIVPKNKKINAPYPYPIKKYRLNLNAFYDYAKTKNIRFDETEKDSIKKLFNADTFRTAVYNKYKTICYVEAIPKYFMRYFYIPLLENKNKIKYSKETLNFILSGGEQYKDVDMKKVLKDINDTIYDESDWNPLENLSDVNFDVIKNLNLKMLKILSN